MFPSTSHLDRACSSVSVRYRAAIASLDWVPLGSGGGFSGAAVWRGDDSAGSPVFALKAWPPDTTADRLAAVHRLMRRGGHLPFVPAVIPAADGATAVVAAGRVWDLTRWMPGTADFHARPSADRLANACVALARLHRAWAPPAEHLAPCPAVRRRLAVLADFASADPGLPHPPPTGHPPLDAALLIARDAVRRLGPVAARPLALWADRLVPIQPCLCDVWHDHVLFTGDAVTGVIDYGAAKPDHPTVDLARLLGDLVGDDDPRFAAGLAAYELAGGSPEPAPGLARLLDRTGAVCGAAVWLMRLHVERRAYPDPAAVARRVAGLAARLASMPAV